MRMRNHSDNFQRKIILALAVLVSCGASNLCEAQGPGISILNQLREKQHEQALETLGTISDQVEAWATDDQIGLAAAGGGIARALAQLDEDEQYNLLYRWSMPTDDRKTIRIFTTCVPRDAPPEIFARVLRERPRETSFLIASIGGIEGLFSTGWWLVKSADELGRLNRLTTELEQLSKQNIPNADLLLMLAKLANRRLENGELPATLQSLTSSLNAKAQKRFLDRPAIHSSTIVLAAAALNHESLQPYSRTTLQTLVDQANLMQAPRVCAFLRYAHAVAVQTHLGKSGPGFLLQNRLKYWVPVSNATSYSNSQGAIPAMWLTHEEHILHLTGSDHDTLFFRYPLEGEFDFTCETQEGGTELTNGGLIYGGLQFEALGSTSQLTVWNSEMVHRALKPCPFVRHEADRAVFNRVSIRSKADQIQFAANLHPVWFDSETALQSPWLGLRAKGEYRPMFRNFKLTGKPRIPREVALTAGDELRGWQSHFFGETQPPFAGSTPVINTPQSTLVPPIQTERDWTMKEGVIEAGKHEVAEGQNRQSLFRYQRPLLEGESIRYDFFYQAENNEVHPALGKLAFLLEPGGVRIRWITDGKLDWTGLPEDNATLEPLNRRGPRPLPLKENDWNTVSVSFAAGKVNLTLNDSLIYIREMERGEAGKFGLYRDRSRGVRVRNVVLTGDWPAEVPKEFLENPTALIESASTAAARP